MRIRRLVPILGLAASLVSPASAQNPGALHWRQKTGLGVMLAGVVAIGIAHERHAPDPLRRRRPIGGGLVVAGAVVALLPVPEPVRRRGGGARRVGRREDVVVGCRRPGPSA